VTRLVLSPRALEDVERLSDFLLSADPAAALQPGEVLFSGLQILRSHPLVVRPAEEGLRELLISRGRTGYVALYV
jgi:plasmid stabilization system protein ParE